MKKLLGIIGAIGLTIPSVSTVISCYKDKSPEDEVFERKLQVYNIVYSIVEDGIEFNDDFFLNYDLINSNQSTKEQIQAFKNQIRMEFNYGNIGIFSKLLTKIIYEKLEKKLPNLKKDFPDFNLVAFLGIQNIDDNSDNNTIDNIIKEEIAYIPFSIGLFFSTYNDTKKFNYGKREGNNKKNLSILRARNTRSAEFIIDGSKSKKLNYKYPIFMFKQKNMISDLNKWIDSYIDIYEKNYFSNFKNNDLGFFKAFYKKLPYIFNSSEKRRYNKNSKEGIIKSINNNESLSFLISYIERETKDDSFYNMQNYIILNLIEKFSVEEIIFVKSYEKNDIIDDSDLKETFFNDNDSFARIEGIAFFDLTLKFSHSIYGEKFYKERIVLYDEIDID